LLTAFELGIEMILRIQTRVLQHKSEHEDWWIYYIGMFRCTGFDTEGERRAADDMCERA
jgi:hypothetical protein